MVVAPQPDAVEVGALVLKDGGNALDGAIATCAMLGVVEPMSCGIGGDLFMIYWDNKTQKLYGLNASGRSPYSLNRAVFELAEAVAPDQRQPVRQCGGVAADRSEIARRNLRHQAAIPCLQPRR